MSRKRLFLAFAMIGPRMPACSARNSQNAPLGPACPIQGAGPFDSNGQEIYFAAMDGHNHASLHLELEKRRFRCPA